MVKLRAASLLGRWARSLGRIGLEQPESMRWKVCSAPLAVLLALASMSCQPRAAQPTMQPTLATAPSQLGAPTLAGQPATKPAESAPNDPRPVLVPTAREALQATDPTTVTLGTGRPALVEFFAFW